MFLKNKKFQNNYVKVVFEIFLDCEFPKCITKFSDVSIPPDNDAFEYMDSYLDSINYPKNKEALFDNVRKYLSGGLDSLYWDYFNTNYVKNFICLDLKRSRVKNNLPEPNIDNVQLLEVIKGFYDFFSSSSKDKFDIGTGTLAKYVRSCFAFYLKGGIDAHPELKNVFGTQMEYDGEILDSAQQLSVDVDSVDSVDFNFKEDVKSIYNCSVILFKNKGDSSAHLYSDIFSCYVKFVSENNYNIIAKNVGMIFCPDHSNYEKNGFLEDSVYFIPIRDSRYAATTEYQSKTLEVRIEMLKEFFKAYSGGIRVEDVFKFIKYMILKDESIRNNKNISNVFSSIGNANRGVRMGVIDIDYSIAISRNKEDITKILEGLFSMYKLINYCTSKNIPLMSVPFEIFRDDRYFIRYDSLEDCIYCFPKTKILINNENNGSATLDDLPNNDITYKQLLMKDECSKYNFLSLVPLLNEAERRAELKKKVNSYLLQFTKIVTGYESKVLGVVKKLMGVTGTKASENNLKILNDAILGGDSSVIERISQYVLFGVTNAEEVKQTLFAVFEEGYPYHDFMERCLWFVDMRFNIMNCIIKKLSLMGNSDLLNTLTYARDGLLTEIKMSIQERQELEEFIKSESLEVNPSYDKSGLAYYEDSIDFCSLLYELIVQEFSDVIDIINSFIKDRKKELKSLHINYEGDSDISDALKEVSLRIYQLDKYNPSSKLNKLKGLSTSVHGILFRNGVPLMDNGFYIHEKGFLIAKGTDGKYTSIALQD